MLKSKRYSLLGYPGPAGMSAYQLAVLNGFVGTEVEWLESLKGADGTGTGNGNGDMNQSVYDINSNDIVDKAESLDDGTYSVSAKEASYAIISEIDRESSGLISGGDLSIGSPTTTLCVTTGIGYVNDGTGIDGTYKRVTWGAFNNIEHSYNTYNHVAINPDGTLDVSATKQDLNTHVYLGCLFFSQGANRFNVVWKTPCWAGNYNSRNSKFIRDIFKALVVRGFEVSEQNGPDFLKLNTTAGSMYLDLTELPYDAKTTLTKLYSCADYGITPNYNLLNTIDVSHWNDTSQNHGTAIVEMTTNYWKKDLVVMNAYGTVYVIYGTNEYSTEDAAKAAPLPSWYQQLIDDGNAFLATIVCQKEDTSIVNRLSDIRPIFSDLFIKNTGSGLINYNDLINKPTHNELDSIQGGQADERYHLDGTQYNNLTSGVYLTTAAQSVHTHNYQSTGAYLTTAMASNAGSLFLPVGNSTDYATSVLSTKFLTTAQPVGAYLTTAAISNHTHSDLYQSTGAYLTTAMQSASSSVFAKIGFTSSSTAGSDIKATHNTDGLSMLIPNYLTIAAGAGDGVNIIAAGGSTAASTGTYVFSNSNGISFSLNGSTITASHNALTTAAASDHTHSNLYQSTGAYLTTAMQSNSSSVFAKTGFTTTATAGTAFVGTNNTDGLKVGVPAFITTAAVSDHTHSNLYVNTSVSANFLTTAMVSNAGSNFVNTGGSTTNSTVGSDFKITMGSGGLNFGVPKWLTTAMLSENTSLYLPIGNSTQWATGTLSSALMPLSYSSGFQTATLVTKFLTTGAASDHTHSNLYLPLGNSTQWATGTLSSALMPLSYSSGFQTATLATKFLTTGAASDHTHGGTSTASTAGVDLKVTSASNGFTIGVPAWITTAAAGGGVAIANSATTYTSGSVIFSGVNATINSSLNGASQYIGISVAAPGAGGGIAASVSGNSTSGASGYSNITSGTMILAGGDNITLSQNGSRISIIGATANGPASIVFSDGSGVTWGSAVAGSTTTITASVNAGGGGVAVAGSNTIYTSGTVYVSGVNLTINSSVNGASQYVQISNRAPNILSFYENMPFLPVTQTLTANSRSWVVIPFVVPQDISFNYIRMLISQGPAVSTTMGTTANTTMTASAANTSYAVIYSQGVGNNSGSLQYVASTYEEVNRASFSFTADPTNGSYYTLSVWQTYPGLSGGADINKSTAHAKTVSNINISYDYSSALTGAKILDIPWATSLSAGNYWLALGESRTSNTNVAAATRLLSVSGNMSLIVASQPNNAYGPIGVATAVSSGITHAGGLWTTNVQGTTASIAMNAISSSASHNRPYFQFWRTA